MASSRASSPASDVSPSSPTQLTPRSKVQAMLAALDDDSDDAATPQTNVPKLQRQIGSALSPKTNVSSDVQHKTQDSTDTDDGEVQNGVKLLPKPRGRLASRMVLVESNSEPEEGRETARERVKKLLLRDANRSQEPNAESEEEEDVPVKSRKLKIRQAQTSISSPVREQIPSLGGLFVSPASNRTASPGRGGSDSDDLPANPNANSRFLALVAKKREERRAKEAEISRQKQKQKASVAELSARQKKLVEEDDIEGSDEDVERQLTQHARPTRKASKKAIEEMHRETQRMSRNMQLAHEARTKKKITRSSLFAKFNYKPEGFINEEPSPARPTSSSSAPQSDVDTKDTPPTSPISHDDRLKITEPSNNLEETRAGELELAEDHRENELPSLENFFSSHHQVCSSPTHGPATTDKGKGKAVEIPDVLSKSSNKGSFTRGAIRIIPPKGPIHAADGDNDSDSDLEIVGTTAPRKSKLDSIFDRVPARQARESHSLHALRMLAHITSPGKNVPAKNVKPSMTATELQTSLQQRARQQAAREREERLEDLRSRGIIIQTAEERERDMAAVEDLIAKARKEAEDIAKEERDAARKERKAKGEEDPLGENSSDDEEWEEAKDGPAEQLSVSGSGSEDDGDDEGDLSGEEVDEQSDDSEIEEGDDEETVSMDGEETARAAVNPLIDNEASESENDEDEDDVDVRAGDEDGFINDEEEDELPAAQSRRTANHHVISDDDDEDFASPQLPHADSPVSYHADSPMVPRSVLRSATKTFIPGLTVAGPAGLGLTQIFAGTMDDSQTQRFNISPSASRYELEQMTSEQDSFAFLRNLPAPEFPAFEATLDENTQDIIRDSQAQVPESQLGEQETQGIQLTFYQSQIHGFDSLVHEPVATQFSESLEATQDSGFQAMSPIRGRFAQPPPSTVETVILEQPAILEVIHESPIAKKKGKLRRKADMDVLSEDEVPAPGIHSTSTNAFDVMRRASRKKETYAEEFDKKKSGAKEMVHEQAEESEDEYAGLGGVSDDGSDDGEDALVAAMIDDEAGKDVDEGKLAAFFADKERASDEKQVEKLFKDITNGFLRRKRGQDYNLSDSDDGGEARRRMKRREFAKMRKALLEDERIGKIAENPKKSAFLRAIEDRDEDEEEVDFLEDYVDSQNASDSQSLSQVENDDSRANNSEPEPKMGPPKRKFSGDGELQNRLPPHLRRTKASGRPSNLSEVRESLSSLIDEPNAIHVAHEVSDSDSDPEDKDGPEAKKKDKENKDPFAPRRTNSIPIVDRISLKRQASNSSISGTARLAFSASSANAGFKVPPLLRRATTNSSISSGSSSNSATERMAGSGDDKSYIKRGGGKTGGVHYFARENERKMKVKEGEKRREQKRFKGAEGRRKAVGGLFGMGKFE